MDPPLRNKPLQLLSALLGRTPRVETLLGVVGVVLLATMNRPEARQLLVFPLDVQRIERRLVHQLIVLLLQVQRASHFQIHRACHDKMYRGEPQV